MVKKKNNKPKPYFLLAGKKTTPQISKYYTFKNSDHGQASVRG